jgi:hypothetical protein
MIPPSAGRPIKNIHPLRPVSAGLVLAGSRPKKSLQLGLNSPANGCFLAISFSFAFCDI